jgi:hypothetical protein
MNDIDDGPGGPEDRPKVTVTEAQKLAREIRAGIDALAARIPGLESPHSSTARQVRGARTVSRKFILTMAAVVRWRRELQVIGTFDPDEALAMEQFNDAFRPVARHLASLLASVNYTMAARRARVARAALTTYAIVRGLARRGGDVELAHYLKSLRRDLNRKGRPRVRPVKDVPSETALAPPPPPTLEPAAPAPALSWLSPERSWLPLKAPALALIPPPLALPPCTCGARS